MKQNGLAYTVLYCLRAPFRSGPASLFPKRMPFPKRLPQGFFWAIGVSFITDLFMEGQLGRDRGNMLDGLML